MEDFEKKFYQENMFLHKYHSIDISKYSFLITGGAGFIGSNIVGYLIKNKAKKIRVLDNLSNGSIKNLVDYFQFSNFEFIEGDIRDYETCVLAVKDINFISHQAALGSVPRSIKDPLLTNDVNINGFLNILNAAKSSKSLIKLVYAASSSTYGDSIELPKTEGFEGKPLSPYAVTKAVNEMYAEVYSRVYSFHTIGLRYFNVFGPRQEPNNPYAAVIPIFCKCFLNDESPKINGDGLTSRDFTFVENVIQANMKALELNILKSINKEKPLKKHEIFNVACGTQISLVDIIKTLCFLSNKNIKPIFNEERIGDVKHSLASILKIRSILNYEPIYSFNDGLNITMDWYNKDK